MVFEGFGITLKRIQHEDIELIRQHRNSENVRRFMEFREEISPEAQEEWFASVNNKSNNYFLIEYKGEKAGLVYGAGLDWEKKETANGGIFIWKENYFETEIPLAASLLLTEISFLIGLKKTYIKVLRDNARAVAFNKNLGYELLPAQEEVENQAYVLTEENFFSKTKRLRALFVKRYGDLFTLTFDHPEDESEAKWLEVLATIPEENKKRLLLKTA